MLTAVCSSVSASEISSENTIQQLDTAALKAGLMAGKTADELIAKAEQYLGSPYRYGASGPTSFDCAGFAMFIYKQFGYTLSRSSRTQVNDGRAVTGDLSNLQKGDLLVFSGARISKTPGHIGIFMSLTEDGKDAIFIHAARGGVQITHLSEPYYSNRFLGARRILPDFIPAIDETTLEEYHFDTEGDVYVRADTLSLGSSDLRVILFDNGKWAFIDENGKVSTPPEGPAMVLYPSGDWRYMALSGRTIPGTPAQDNPATAPSGNNQQSNSTSQQTVAVTPESTETEEQVFHVIKSGDTLGKLAAKYHTSVRAICSMNNITERTILRIGKKLRVK